MKVSVIIPVYNEEKYIATCLESLKNQKEKPDEIIVIDNNCTDNTIEVAKKFKVRIVREKTQGMIPARNRGFDNAKYDIIARSDADNILPVDWVKRIKSNFEHKNIDAMTGPLFFNPPLFPNVATWISWFKLMSKMLGYKLLIGPNMALTKKIWKKVRRHICLDDKEVHEDFDLAIHIQEVGGVVELDKKLIVQTSGRRLKENPLSLLLDYPKRFFDMTVEHRKKQFRHKYSKFINQFNINGS